MIDCSFGSLFLALLIKIARYCYLAHRLDSFAVLFSFQRTIALQATWLSYHIRRGLSNDFFEIFLIALSDGAASSATGIILSHPGLLCQQVFLNFFMVQGSGFRAPLGRVGTWLRLKTSIEWEIRNEKCEMRNGGAAHFVILSGEKRRMLKKWLIWNRRTESKDLSAAEIWN